MTIGRNNHNRLRPAAAALAAVLIMLCGGKLQAEYLFLKNGTVIEGRILNESPSSMTVLTNDGKTVNVKRSTVLRVMYTQLYRGKLYIQKTDGRVLEAYIIDEDQEYYTVRPELNSPKEFTIRRDDVLFMTRKNPSALAGEVSYKHVDLSWRKPYTPDNPVKHFKIYIRLKGGDYTVAGVTSGTQYRVKGLQCNSVYYAMVTAVDRSGYESLPSNVVRLTTRKGRPVPPGHVHLLSVTSDAGGPCTAHLAWSGAVDPCGGTITEYGVYLKDETEKNVKAAKAAGKGFPGYRLAGKTSGAAIRIPGLKDKTPYRVMVTSIDNTRDESPAGWTLSFNTRNLMPEYPFPVSCERTLTGSGADGTVKLSWARAVDRDGTVAAYRIYRKIKNEYALQGATDRTDFVARGLSTTEKHYFTVRSVDNRGGESSDSYPASTGLVRYVDITAKGSLLLPVGKYGRLYHPGYGGTIMVSSENLFLERLLVGVEAGYLHFGGKTEVSIEAALVPFMAVMSYRFRLARWVSIEPSVGFGGCYNMVGINAMGAVPAGLYFLKKYTQLNTVEFIFSAGAQSTFSIGKIALLYIGGAYHGIAERGGLLSFFSVHGGVGVRI